MKRLSISLSFGFLLVIVFLLLGAAPNGYRWNLPKGFPEPRVPEDNPMSEAKVELGRFLFYDVRLSGNQTQSCASCHQQGKAFSDGIPTAIGSTGQEGPRNAPSLTNIAYFPVLTWANPKLTTLEKQILVPMFGEFPVELGLSGLEDELISRLASDPDYPDLFTKAFPGELEPIKIGNIVKALASFVRSLTSFDSAYDRYVYGKDKTALSESARLGMNLFFSERFECHHCHGGFNFTQTVDHANLAEAQVSFHNTGLYNLDANGAYPEPNQGLFEFTLNPADQGKFRTPSLRNVALSAPYMHDGSIETLEEVIDFYASGGRNINTGEYQGDGRNNPNKSGLVPGFVISPEERQALIDFLHSLTDEGFIYNADFSNPFGN
jgi:cytochrome c peroxidase